MQIGRQRAFLYCNKLQPTGPHWNGGDFQSVSELFPLDFPIRSSCASHKLGTLLAFHHCPLMRPNTNWSSLFNTELVSPFTANLSFPLLLLISRIPRPCQCTASSIQTPEECATRVLLLPLSLVLVYFASRVHLAIEGSVMLHRAKWNQCCSMAGAVSEAQPDPKVIRLWHGKDKWCPGNHWELAGWNLCAVLLGWSWDKICKHHGNSVSALLLLLVVVKPV